MQIPGYHHLATRFHLLPVLRDLESVLILGKVMQYGNV